MWASGGQEARMAGGLGGCWAGESLAFLQRGVTRVHGCLHVTTGLSACSAQGQLPHSSALCWSLSTLILLCLTQGSLSSLFQGRGTGRCFCSSPATGQGGLGGASTLGREERPKAVVRGGPGKDPSQVRSRAGPTGCSSHPSYHLWVRVPARVQDSGAGLRGRQAA